MTHIICIDGGASKTEVIVFDTRDNSKAYMDFDGLNFQNIGILQFETLFLSMIAEIYDALEISNKDILGILIGLSGLDNSEDKEILLNSILKCNIDERKIFLCNDCELLLFAKNKFPAISLTAGTGSISYSIDDEFKITSAGGHGYLLSDLGSGYFVGLQILKEYIKYVDYQVPYLAVFDEIEEHFGYKKHELIHFLKTATVKQIASVCKLVLDKATDNDPLCATILKASAYNLASLAASLFLRLDKKSVQEIPVILSGSLFKNKMLFDVFREQLISITAYENFIFEVIKDSICEEALEFATKVFEKN